MTEQEINEAIGIECGLAKIIVEVEHTDGYQWTEVANEWWVDGKKVELPDFCNDLNAIQSAVLAQTGGFGIRFASCLQRRAEATGKWIHALTAKDWSECFLECKRTENEWRVLCHP